MARLSFASTLRALIEAGKHGSSDQVHGTKAHMIRYHCWKIDSSSREKIDQCFRAIAFEHPPLRSVMQSVRDGNARFPESGVVDFVKNRLST